MATPGPANPNPRFRREMPHTQSEKGVEERCN
uniref:Uncharacterized protein n=1 Tax=Arundo donax TaxID=35708 RepID=A0A0A9AUG8_ARUDO